MRAKTINDFIKDFLLSCHIIITYIEGVLVLLYTLGLFFVKLNIQFKSKIIMIPKSILVMSMMPLSVILIPFLIYSTFISIYYGFSRSQLDRNLRIFKIHLIYMMFFILFVLFWVL